VENSSTLAGRLRDLRKEDGKTQDDVADAVGIKRGTLAAIEAGHDNPGRETLIALANYYRVSLDWLTTGKGEMRPLRALNADEERLLWAYRKLPRREAQAHLRLLTERAETLAPEPLPALEDSSNKRGQQ
jgi:transcriptional regulator with XRE-family HTH domain